MNSSTKISEAKVEIHTAQNPAKGGLNILFVDDHQLVRDEFRSLLVSQGWGCECANGGEDALRCLASGIKSFDILVTDHNMPGMNGLELVAKVRATKFTGKILVHSTMLLCIERAAFDDLKVDAIVPKSGNPAPLIKTIQEFQRAKSTV